MKIIVIVFIIVLAIGALVMYILNNYNKLVLLKNASVSVWNDINNILKIRFEYATNYIAVIAPIVPVDIINRLQDVTARYRMILTVEEHFSLYEQLEKVLMDAKIIIEDKNFNDPNLVAWQQAFDDNKMQLNQLRNDYNNTILKINNCVESFPTNIIAKLFGFQKWVYFRNEE